MDESLPVDMIASFFILLLMPTDKIRGKARPNDVAIVVSGHGFTAYRISGDN